jgi:hypothetical protein
MDSSPNFGISDTTPENTGFIVADGLKNLSSVYRMNLNPFVKDVFPLVAAVISCFAF